MFFVAPIIAAVAAQSSINASRQAMNNAAFMAMSRRRQEEASRRGDKSRPSAASFRPLPAFYEQMLADLDKFEEAPPAADTDPLPEEVVEPHEDSWPKLWCFITGKKPGEA